MTEPVVEIPFAAGINQSDREELVDAARAFTTLQNVRQRKRGAVGKRYAYTSLGNALLDGTTRPAGHRLVTNGDQICVITGERIEVYVPGLECSVPRSKVPEATYAFFEAPSVAPESIVADVTYVNGYIAIATYANSASGGWCLFVTLIDAETRAVVRGPEVVSSAATAGGYGLAALGTSVYAAHCDSTADELNVFRLDTASAATITTGWTAHLTITATDCTRQMAISSLSDRIAVAFDMTSGTSRVRVRTFNASGLVESVDINTASVSPEIGTLDISEGESDLWVCWAEGTQAHVIGLNPTDIDGTPVATNAFVLGDSGGFDRLSITPLSSGKALLMGRGDSGGIPATLALNIKTLAGAAAPDSTGGQFFNAYVAGRPFRYNGLTYAWWTSTNGDDLTLCEITVTTTGAVAGSTALRPVCAPITRGLVEALGSFWQPRCRTVSTGADTFAFAFGSKKTGLTDGTLALALDFADANRWTAAEHFGSTYLSGGITTVFDGTSVFESSFLCAPPSPAADTSASGSQTFTNGGRRYVAVYASVDADGNLHVSGVSNPSDATGNIVSKQIDVYLLPLEITMRGAVDASDFGSSVQVFLYATLDTGGEAPYHYVGSAQNPPGGWHAGPVIITDGLDENSLAAGALLYGSGNLPGTVTNGQPGGPQDHRAPPGLSCLVSYNGMLCGISGREVWACSQPVYGEGIWWSPVFAAQGNEALTALFIADGTLYATAARSIYALSGEPPNDAGTSGGLSAPRKLAIDRGCVNPRSVCVTNIGTFLQSERGYELFRQGGIDPIGDYIADTLESFPLVTSAVLDVPNGLVRIACEGTIITGSDGEGGFYTATGGRDLIFDLILGVWISVDVKAAEASSKDAALLPLDGARVYGWLGSDGQVWVEDSTSFRDAGATWVAMIAETGWVHIAGLQGEQFIDRILLLAKSLTSHDLTIELAFDYSTTYTSSKTFTSTQIDALVRSWLDREVAQSTSQAVRVRLTDAAPSGEDATIGTGEGGTWIALSVNGQPHKGAKRTSGAQRGG